jgi:hypothetical protein
LLFNVLDRSAYDRGLGTGAGCRNSAFKNHSPKL